MKIRLFFRWYDFWVGVYVDVGGRAIYICPVPMFGLKVRWVMNNDDGNTFMDEQGRERWVKNGKLVRFSSDARKEFNRQNYLKAGLFHSLKNRFWHENKN